jgi:probable HAF family extracellular repeat protein
MQDLGTRGGRASSACGINPTGQIVGVAENGKGKAQAFLYRDGRMTDLNDLLPPGSGWVPESAASINDAGQIVGSGMHHGQRRAFLLTFTGSAGHPVSELPATAST